MDGELFISGGHALIVLEAGKQVLDEMARPIAMWVPSARFFSMAAWRNHRMTADLFDGLDERVRVVALIGDDRSGQPERVEQGRACVMSAS